MPPSVYVDRDLFNTLTGNTSTGADPRIDTLLELASRLYDRASGVAPGMWGPIASTAYKFSANGGKRLWLRDTADNQYLLRTITSNSLAIDSDADGSYDDYLWDLSDAWVRGTPENAVALSEAFTGLELLSHLSTAPISSWPVGVSCIQITGTWGYPAVPAAVQARVADIAHSLSQRGYAGGYGTEEALQMGVPVWVMGMIDANYSHRLPF